MKEDDLEPFPRFAEESIRLHEAKIKVSSCCGASIIKNTDLCSKCKEHCEAISEEEYYEGEKR